MNEHSCATCRRWHERDGRQTCYVCAAKLGESQLAVCPSCWRAHERHVETAERRDLKRNVWRRTPRPPMDAQRFAWRIDE